MAKRNMSRQRAPGGILVGGCCVVVVALAVAIAALAVALGNKAPKSSSLRLPLTNKTDVRETALLIGAATGDDGDELVYPTEFSQDMYLHFQRFGDAVSMSLELGSEGNRMHTKKFDFVIDKSLFLLAIKLDSVQLADYVSPCYGSFGNRLIFTTGPENDSGFTAFQSNAVGLLQSTNDNFLILYPRADGDTFHTVWQAGRHFIPVFSISYGAPNSKCPANAMKHATLAARLVAAAAITEK